MASPRKELTTAICECCHQAFAYAVRSDLRPRRYCSQQCRAAMGRVEQQRKKLRLLQKLEVQKFSEDPWKTGQLPASVTMNSLWKMP